MLNVHLIFGYLLIFPASSCLEVESVYILLKMKKIGPQLPRSLLSSCWKTSSFARLCTWFPITSSYQYLISSFSFSFPLHSPLVLFVRSSSSSFSPPCPCPFVLISSCIFMPSSSSSPRLCFFLSPCRSLVFLSQTPPPRPPSSSLFPNSPPIFHQRCRHHSKSFDKVVPVIGAVGIFVICVGLTVLASKSQDPDFSTSGLGTFFQDFYRFIDLFNTIFLVYGCVFDTFSE